MEENVKKEEVSTEVTGEVLEETEEQEQTEYTGKKVTTSITYDFDTLKYYHIYYLKIRKKLPIYYLVFSAFAILGAIFVLVTAFTGKEFDVFTAVVSGIILMFGAYFLKGYFTFEKTIDTNIERQLTGKPYFEQQLLITEEKIVLLLRNGETAEYDWLSISEIQETKEYFYLYIQRAPLIVSKNPDNIIEGTYADLEAIINEQIEHKPYKKYNGVIKMKPSNYVHRYADGTTEVEEVMSEDLQEVTEEQEETKEND